MEIAMHVAESAMIGAVLATAVEPVLMRALVNFGYVLVEAAMLVMITGVVIIVRVVVSHRRRQWQGET